MYRFPVFLLVLVFSFSNSFCQQASIQIDAARVLNAVEPTISGSCMEDVNHEIYGGLYDQRVFGESFEEPFSGVYYTTWRRYAGYWAADREYADGGVTIIPGRNTKRMIGEAELSVEPDDGAKLINDSLLLDNGSMKTRLRFLDDKGVSGGILVRVTNAGVGENSLNGYEVALNKKTGTLQLIKFRQSQTLLKEEPVAFSAHGWNDIEVVLNGPHLAVYLNSSKNPVLSFTDRDEPFLSGKIGLRTWQSPLAFSDITVQKKSITASVPLVRNEKFQVSDLWDPLISTGVNARFRLVSENAYNGMSCQEIEWISGKGRAGVANCGLNHWGIAIQQGQKFKGSVAVKAQGLAGDLTVALENKEGSVRYAKQELAVSSAGWKEYHFELEAAQSDSNARLVLYIQNKGKVWLDQVTLFSPGKMEFKGLPLRKDIADALVSEGLTFMRYGGSMVNARGYRFKNMIGPRSRRPPYLGQWNRFSTNGFGIEEFLQFCEAAGFTGAFAINIEEKPQDAADMVEYLNGNPSTPWGKKRAAGGHVAPYKIKYIEIGNEEVLSEGDNGETVRHYIDRFHALYQAIHSKDSSIMLVCAAWWYPESANTEKIFRALDGKASFWDYHVWADQADAGVHVDSGLTEMDSLFHVWDPATKMKCVIFEENGGLHNMQRALGHATILNAVRRHGDFVMTSCPANALQPYRQNDNSWDQGQIFFTPAKVWGMPPFYVQKMASANYLPERIYSAMEGAGLDVSATRSETGNALVIHVVNTSSEPVHSLILLKHFTGAGREIKAWTLSAGSEEENTLQDPVKISPKETLINTESVLENGFVFPPFSYVILRFEK